MAFAESLDALLRYARQADDPYFAVAVHPYAGAGDRGDLECAALSCAKHKRLFASAPYTPASLLDVLACGHDRKIRVRVAKHPATSVATLQRLVDTDGSRHVLESVAGHGRATQRLLASLPWSRSPEVRRAVCENPNTGLAVLRRLVAGATLAEMKGIAKNAEADGELLRQLWARGDVYLRGQVAAHPNCPAALQTLAEHHPDALVRRKLAENPGLSMDALRRMITDVSSQVRAAATRNMAVPISALRALSNDPSRQVRRNKARRASLPRDIALLLAADTDAWVRRWVARNPTTLEDVLHDLAGDEVMEVRRGVARNPVCPQALVRELARDQQSWVRAGVALRSDIPRSVIRELAAEEDIDVVSGLGQNPNTPDEILQRIAHNADHDVRRSVILNKQAPRRLLSRLVEDPYPLNRAMLARHAALANEDVWCLVDDPEPQVRFAAAQALASRFVGPRGTGQTIRRNNTRE